MVRPQTRRAFLKASAASIASGIGLGMPDIANAVHVGPARNLMPLEPDIEPLVRLIESTSCERMIPTIAQLIARGESYRRMFTAVSMTIIRNRTGAHDALRLHSIHQLGLDLGRQDHLMPLMWSAGQMDPESFPEPMPPLRNDRLPPIGRAAANFDAAMPRGDWEDAEHALIVLARNEGPRRAFERLWYFGAALCGGGDTGHAAIGVSSAYRTAEAMGWRHAEPVLRFVVRNCSALDRQIIELNRTNLCRAREGAPRFPADWSATRSNRDAVLDLVAQLRDGTPAEVCRTTNDRLLAGRLQAGTIWDALILSSCELGVTHRYGGPSWRSRHSITMINALHYAFRTCLDAEIRAYILLEAVHWMCEFYTVQRRRNFVRDFNIARIPQVDGPNNANDAVEEIFSMLPRRAALHWYRDRSSEDRAMQLAYAYAGRHPHGLLMQTARRLVCYKAAESHHMKFPVAIWENYDQVSPEWRRHVLAASVTMVQGSYMEDAPHMVQAREELRRVQ